MNDQRISTGIGGLDEILYGGFRPRSSYLVIGAPGTGKTILALQFMNESLRRRASCLYITFAETEETLRRNVADFGWDLAGLVIEDFSKPPQGAGPKDEYTVFSPSEVEGTPVWERIRQALDRHRPDRVVIDSATFLRYLSTDNFQFHRNIQWLVNEMSEMGCVSLLLFEPLELERENAIALAVDGVIALHNDLSNNRVIEIRTIEVIKFRGASYLSGRHPLRITSEGITVWPHRIEPIGQDDYERELLRSGLPELDDLLMGGLPSGTCTLISGPAGAGKTTLGIQYLVTAAAAGGRCVIYSFEEGLASMLARCSSLNIPLEPLVENGSILVRVINPLDSYPDEFLAMLRNDIQHNKSRIVMLDSLRGYNLAMEQFGETIAAVQNIVNFIRLAAASIFIINEQEPITGDLKITEHGVSYLSDNILLLRYAERFGEVIRVISCFKKRIGAYQADLLEFSITPAGIRIGEKLSDLQGLLTGLPMNVERHRNKPDH
ncbi:MAG: ATPase domain-containing protein [Candidatus Sumerlaeia bacterium]